MIKLFSTIIKDLLKKVTDNKKSKKTKKDKKYRSQVVIPYVEGVSETVDRVPKKYRVATDAC